MQSNLSTQNRGFLYSDAVFETIKVVNGEVLFAEDHYFRLMASMRILRMEIPMSLTFENFQEIILSEVQKNQCSDSARVRITYFRNEGGMYLPETNSVSYIIDVKKLESSKYIVDNTTCEVDIYKDFFITKQLLSTLKTTSKNLNVLASIYASENDLQNCILLNNEKQVAEVINGNLFLVTGNTVITPPITDGCLNGIMRKQIIDVLKSTEGIVVKEESISPFDLQKAGELFYSNVIIGIKSITQYRKKTYATNFSEMLLSKINEKFKLV